MILPPEQMEVAVRGWAPPPGDVKFAHRKSESGYRDLGPSEWSLVLDSETTTDAAQRLRVGAYQVWRGKTLHERGLFYEPTATTRREKRVLKEYAEAKGLALLTRRRFVETVFFRVACELRSLVVGFNLPFDLSRLAIDHYAARSKEMRGGFAFVLSRDPRWPRIQIKPINARAAFIRFTTPEGRHPEKRNRDRGGDMANHRGYFSEVAAVGAALLGQKHTLGSLAEVLGTEHRKGRADHGERIDPAYLDYLLADVQVTWECHQELCARYETYALRETPIWWIFSEASVGKAHLREIGVKPWRRTGSEWPDSIIATVLETYYGGRTEAKIRRVPTPGILVDFLSQYSTVFSLMGLWRYVIAQEIEWWEEDPEVLQSFIDGASVEHMLQPEAWLSLGALVLVQPDGDLLPTRARYGSGTSSFNVALSIRSGGPPQWYTVADCIASRISMGKSPRVLKALRFRPGGPQEDLRTIRIAGDSRFQVDPYADDLVKRLIELRAEVKQELQEARLAGDRPRGARLDAIQQGMKITASAIAYGIGIEMNVVEHARPVTRTVVLPDGSTYETRVGRSDEPGTHFNPLVSTLASAGGRLLLSMAMVLAEKHGGLYAFCDTDSLFLVATPDGPLPSDHPLGDRCLTWGDVEQIADAFQPLNPYDQELVSGSILQVEDVSRDPATGQLREVEAYALASKRYALFARGADGRPQIIGDASRQRRSEHGLGHLLRPEDPDPESDPQPFFDRWWEHLLCSELGVEDPAPEWMSLPAVGRLRVSSQREEATFRGYNSSREYRERVRPFNFLGMYHVARVLRGSRSGPRCLVAPYEARADRWLDVECFDRHDRSGRGHRVRIDHPYMVLPESIPVQSVRDYFDEYLLHPEMKLADADGRPCRPFSRVGHSNPDMWRQQVCCGSARRRRGSRKAPEILRIRWWSIGSRRSVGSVGGRSWAANEIGARTLAEREAAVPPNAVLEVDPRWQSRLAPLPWCGCMTPTDPGTIVTSLPKG